MIVGTGCQTRAEVEETKTIEIVVNGSVRNVPAGITLDRLLPLLEVDPGRVAVERNRMIVRKPEWQATHIESGDQLEIVWFVGGG
jgi:sulfur carrier protein